MSDETGTGDVDNAGDNNGVDSIDTSDSTADTTGVDNSGKTPEQTAADTTAAEQAKLYGAPDKYELTVPEGTQNPDGFLDAFSGVVKKYNLSQEGAQSLLNDLATDIQPKMVAARQAEWDGVVAGWETAAKSDTEIGGAKYDEVKTQALRARNTFSTPELDAFLTQYRIDGHPEVTRLFYRLSQSMREDSVIKPDTGVSQNDERINNFYSTMKK